MPQSAAELFFKELCIQGSNAFAFVEALISERADENEWREFKEAHLFSGASTTGNPSVSVKDTDKRLKAIWSECLGAFGNSGGGVLIWGIRAPSRFAEGKSLSPDAFALADRLVQIQNDAVEPPVPGVEVRAVVESGEMSGFVVCYIPDSSYSPHRARWADKEYYIRSADSNMPMRTEVLRRMFSPRTAPLIVPIAKLSVSAGMDKLLHIQMSAKLKNIGSASARDVFVEVSTHPRMGYLPFPVEELWVTRKFLGGGHECQVTIHPNQTIRFLNNYAADSRYPGCEEAMLPERIVFEFQIYSQDASASRAQVIFEKDDFLQAYKSGQGPEREGAVLS